MSLKHDQILAPITALDIFQDGSGRLLVLAGEGPYLKIFDAATSRLLAQKHVLQDQAIHGIVAVSETVGLDALQVVLWGGSQLQLLKKACFDQLLSNRQASSCLLRSPETVSDWILDVAIDPLHLKSCALVTAHNTVLRARLKETKDDVVVEALSSPSRSILYSAHVLWESSQSLLIAAGTVFGEIIVWRCSPGEHGEVLFTFTGHEGSIFGVNISSPFLLASGHTRRLLASCSDDRTIRIWDLTSSPPCGATSRVPSMVRETGMGVTNGLAPEIVEPMATVMAHASRIWQVKFLDNFALVPRVDSMDLLSFGEDSTTIHWVLELEDDLMQDTGLHLRDLKKEQSSLLAARLKNIETYAFHSGKHIWSTTIRSRGFKSLVGTGGADSKISLLGILPAGSKHSIEDVSSDRFIPPSVEKQTDGVKSVLHSYDIDDAFTQADIRLAVSSALPPTVETDTPIVEGRRTDKQKPKRVLKDSFNKYAYISSHAILVTTTFGRLLRGDIDGQNRLEWTTIELPTSAMEDLKSYSVITSFPDLGLAFLGSASGELYCYHNGSNIVNVGKVDGKITDMFSVIGDKFENHGILVTTLMKRSGRYFQFGKNIPRLSSATELVLPEKFIVTSANRLNDTFILGSRLGALALYDTSQSLSPLLVHKVTGSSADDAISSIISIPGAVNRKDAFDFLVTRRDGVYTIFSLTSTIRSTTRILNLKPIHDGTPPFGPLITSAWFQYDQLYLSGFKSTSFVIWNESLQSLVMSVPCGGTHRNHAYSPLASIEGGLFIYTKASRLHHYYFVGESHQTIKAGGHGREIKSCAVSSKHLLIATGAEDTAIRLWSYDSTSAPDSHFQCEAVVQKHTTGIQHLHFHDDFLLSSGGNEEFFIFRLERIDGFGLGTICVAGNPWMSEEHDLRITCFDVSNLSAPECSLLITMGYSDSTIRSYAYSTEMGFQLLYTGHYTSSCITHLQHLHLDILESSPEFRMITVATDGYLTLWSSLQLQTPTISAAKPTANEESSEMAILSTTKVHQNAVKSFDMVTTSEYAIVATGGDDNALGITIFLSAPAATTTSTPLSRPPIVFTLKSAHAAAITGLSFFPSPSHELRSTPSSTSSISPHRFIIISSGNDQRVKVWEVQIRSITTSKGQQELSRGRGDESFQVKIRLMEDVHTAIADVGDLVVFGDHGAAEDDDDDDDHNYGDGDDDDQVHLLHVDPAVHLDETESQAEDDDRCRTESVSTSTMIARSEQKPDPPCSKEVQREKRSKSRVLVVGNGMESWVID